MNSKLDAHFIDEYRERNAELEDINTELLEALENLVRDSERMDALLLENVAWDNVEKGTITRAKEAIRKASR